MRVWGRGGGRDGGGEREGRARRKKKRCRGKGGQYEGAKRSGEGQTEKIRNEGTERTEYKAANTQLFIKILRDIRIVYNDMRGADRFETTVKCQ